MKKSRIIKVMIALIVIAGLFSARYIRAAKETAKNDQPSKAFIETVDALYQENSDITVQDQNNNDVTAQFKAEHQKDYDSHDYQAIRSDVIGRYSFSGKSLPGSKS
ncbi:MAG: hypothetical protein SOI44_06160 [Lactimicrobium sp.]|jgi:hypothetical protein|uniref:hypothetical protein n=1 Tax=Lactimicrobium sp. TaxID=2563780 RepID=UPI002F357294